MLPKIVFILFALFSFNAMASAPNDPYELVRYVAEKTLKRIEVDNKQIEREPNHLKKIVSEELMPHIDYQLAARFILANTEAQDTAKNAFIKAFGDYLTTTYAALFSNYEGQQLLVDKPVNVQGKKIVGVEATLKDIDGPDRAIEFKLNRDKQSGKWAVFDVVIEGVSLLQSKRAELRPILRQPDGVDKATKILSSKAQNPIKL